MTKLVLFDFDGTLVDTAPDIALHTNRVLEEYGLPTQEMSAIQKAIGRGMRELLADLGFDRCPERLEAAVDRLRALYAERPVVESRVYPGVIEVLSGPLKGLDKAIVTNKPQHLTDQIVERLGLGRFFGAVLGDGAGFPRKPDPASTMSVLKKFSAAPAEALFVGDSAVDHQTALNAGTGFVWVDYGYDRTLERYEDVRRCSSAADLPRFVGPEL